MLAERLGPEEPRAIEYASDRMTCYIEETDGRLEMCTLTSWGVRDVPFRKLWPSYISLHINHSDKASATGHRISYETTFLSCYQE